MDSIKNIRIQAGLTQKDLASHIGITRSKLIRIEGSLHTLNSVEIQKVSELLKYSEQSLEEKKVKDEETKLIAACVEQLNTSQYEASRLQRKLEKMEASYAVWHDRCNALNRLKASLTSGSTAIDAAIARAEIKLSRCSLLQQATIKKRIAGLHAEILFLEEEVQKLREPGVKEIAGRQNELREKLLLAG